MAFAWNDERLAMLREGRMDGLSFTQVAAKIGGGVTKNACIGKAQRAGAPIAKPIVRIKLKRSRTPKAVPKVDLKRRPEPVARIQQSSEAAPVQQSGRQTVDEAGQADDRMTPVGLAPPIAEPAAQRSSPVNIFALRNHHCRYPLWHQDDDLDCESRFYCGEAAIGVPYCPEHSAKAAGKHYTPTEGLAYRMAAARAQKARLHTRLKIGVGA